MASVKSKISHVVRKLVYTRQADFILLQPGDDPTSKPEVLSTGGRSSIWIVFAVIVIIIMFIVWPRIVSGKTSETTPTITANLTAGNSERVFTPTMTSTPTLTATCTSTVGITSTATASPTPTPTPTPTTVVEIIYIEIPITVEVIHEIIVTVVHTQVVTATMTYTPSPTATYTNTPLPSLTSTPSPTPNP